MRKQFRVVPKKVPTLTVCRKCKHPVNLNGGFPPHPSICTLRPSHPVDITFSFIQAFMRKKYCFFFSFKTKVCCWTTLCSGGTFPNLCLSLDRETSISAHL